MGDAVALAGHKHFSVVICCFSMSVVLWESRMFLFGRRLFGILTLFRFVPQDEESSFPTDFEVALWLGFQLPRWYISEQKGNRLFCSLETSRKSITFLVLWVIYVICHMWWLLFLRWDRQCWYAWHRIDPQSQCHSDLTSRVTNNKSPSDHAYSQGTVSLSALKLNFRGSIWDGGFFESRCCKQSQRR